MRLIKILFWPLLVTMSIAACDVGTERVVPRGVRMQVQVEDLDKQITTDEDTIRLSTYKLLLDEFLLKEQSGNQLQSQVDAIEMVYTENDIGSPKVLVQGNVAYDDFDNFTGVEIKIAPPDSGDSLNDSEFRSGDTGKSFILKGEINGDQFSYSSDFTADRLVEFDPIVELTDNTPVIEMRITFDPAYFLVDPGTNSILDPRDEANKNRIDSLMLENIVIDAERVELN